MVCLGSFLQCPAAAAAAGSPLHSDIKCLSCRLRVVSIPALKAARMGNLISLYPALKHEDGHRITECFRL